jgi:hypothetical protein
LHARCRDADRARHRPAAPAPEIGRRRHGALQHLLGRRFRQPSLAATSRRIAQSSHPTAHKPPDPAIDLQTRFAQAFGVGVRLRRSVGLRYLILGAPLAWLARKRACRSAAVIAVLPNGLGPRFMSSTIRYVTSLYRRFPPALRPRWSEMLLCRTSRPVVLSTVSSPSPKSLSRL